MGAKQNRVLNKSILLSGDSETVIPVSCTEQSRWRYTSAEFSPSDVIMFQRARASKAQSVSGSLHAERGYSSDQSRVWEDIREFQRKAGTSSPTQAMQDVYTAKAEELNEYVQAFECKPQQRGSLVFINGEPAGFDVISSEEAYAELHQKLVKSYAVDTLLQIKERFDEPSAHKAEVFLKEARECEESKFASIGQGFDYRFKGAKIVGSALVFEKSIIHLAFFRLDKDERDDHLSGYSQRRDFRRSRR
ncbi:ARPP-1 family domain-containing protein [Chloroflexota bacterium]